MPPTVCYNRNDCMDSDHSFHRCSMDTDQVYNEQLILATKVRRRNKLQLQLAVFGQTADPSVSIQIEDLDKEIAELSKNLNIKPEGILIDTSVNLKDRRVLLLQVSYDVSNVIM